MKTMNEKIKTSALEFIANAKNLKSKRVEEDNWSDEIEQCFQNCLSLCQELLAVPEGDMPTLREKALAFDIEQNIFIEEIERSCKIESRKALSHEDFETFLFSVSRSHRNETGRGIRSLEPVYDTRTMDIHSVRIHDKTGLHTFSITNEHANRNLFVWLNKYLEGLEEAP